MAIITLVNKELLGRDRVTKKRLWEGFPRRCTWMEAQKDVRKASYLVSVVRGTSTSDLSSVTASATRR